MLRNIAMAVVVVAALCMPLAASARSHGHGGHHGGGHHGGMHHHGGHHGGMHHRGGIMAACITVAYTEDMDTTPVITGAGIIIRTLDTFGTAVGTSMASVPAGDGQTITMSLYGFAAEHITRAPALVKAPPSPSLHDRTICRVLLQSCSGLCRKDRYSLVNQAHHRFGVTRAGCAAPRHQVFDAAQIGRRQLHVDGCDIFFQIFATLRTGDRHDVVTLCQVPRRAPTAMACSLFLSRSPRRDRPAPDSWPNSRPGISATSGGNHRRRDHRMS